MGFLGLGGLHQFYTGKFGKGILYFLTCGLCLFGTIVDMIKISMGQFVDSTGAPLKE